VCSKWKATGKVEADTEANILPSEMEFVRKEITKHPLRGVG
jgi:hypothetical protein